MEIQEGPRGKYFPLPILTDSADGSTITFKPYDATSGKAVDLKETVPFQAQGVVAEIDAPKPFIFASPAQKSKKGDSKSSSAKKSSSGSKKSEAKKSGGSSKKKSDSGKKSGGSKGSKGKKK